jgi:aminomethyltransferase
MMKAMRELHLDQNALLAEDGIPLHYGDLKGEYLAGLKCAVLMDRSHEGRLRATGQDRLALLHRISTNDLANVVPGDGRPTVFTNAIARILDRAMVYNRDEGAILLSEPGRGAALMNYLQRNVFFNDDFQVSDLSPTTHLFALHGPNADLIIADYTPTTAPLPPYRCIELTIGGVSVTAARRKAISGSHWAIMVPFDHGPIVWANLLEGGKPQGLAQGGSLAYNALRIRAGYPATGRELSMDYIPLEVGLWDEVSFAKGCYTGQEIIARMESRNRLAKVMVKLELSAPVSAPADLFYDGHKTGTVTSAVTTPLGEHLGIGFVRFNDAQPGQQVTVDHQNISGTIIELAGAPPPQLAGYEPAAKTDT